MLGFDKGNTVTMIWQRGLSGLEVKGYEEYWVSIRIAVESLDLTKENQV